MKRFLFSVWLYLFSSLLYSQSKFTFKIEGITSMADAKEITDPIRELFGTYPVFNDSTDTFQFISFKNVEISDLYLLGHDVTYFLKQQYAIIEEEK